MSVKKAASVTLAGVMAVGMVPAAAFAADAPETTADEGISTLVATGDFTNGTMTAASYWLTGGDAISWVSGSISIQATGEAINVVPTAITPYGGASETVATVTLVGGTGSDKNQVKSWSMEDGYQLSYWTANADGSKGTQVASVVNPGKYIAAVTAVSGDYAGQEFLQPFTVTPANMSNIDVYQVNPENATDFTVNAQGNGITYTGATLNLGIYDSVLNKSMTDQFTVKWLKGGSNVSDPSINITDAGSYVAVLTGTGIYGNQEKQIAFTVNKFDLDSATVEVPSTVVGNRPTVPTSVTNGTVKLANPSLVKLELAGTQAWGANGAYTLKAFPAKTNDPNFTFSGTGVATAPSTISKVGALATFQYNGAALVDATINMGDAGATGFNLSKISALVNGKAITGWTADWTGGTPNVTVTKKGDDAFTAPANGILNTAGVYTVKVTVPAPTTGDDAYAYAGEQTVTVTVQAGTINADTSLFVNYGGKAVDKINMVYDGTGIVASDITWSVKGLTNVDSVNDATAVTATNAAGEKVAFPLKNAGTYTIAINPTGYAITGANTVPVTISKLDVTAGNISLGDGTHAAASEISTLGNGAKVINTTAAVTLPTNVWYNTGVKAASGDTTINGIAYATTAAATVTWEKYDDASGEWSPISALTPNDEFKVRATIKAATGNENSNYVFSDTANNQTVVEFEATPDTKGAFVDVLPGSWYFKAVNAAEKLDYMNGYGDTGLFGPNDKLTRAQAVQILFNMAGGVKSGDPMPSLPGVSVGDYAPTYQTFDDVPVNSDFAKAISWAKATGISTGYADGSNKFGPNDEITREQFATMLYRYAQKCLSATVDGVDIDKALASKPDGSKVDSWARDGVAWAVQNEFMGVNSDIVPLGKVTRAEAAAMAVRYQPSKITA